MRGGAAVLAPPAARQQAAAVERLEMYLSRLCGGSTPEISQQTRRVILAGGKRLRPRLAWLCGRLKIDASQVLAIGDSENDYEQIRWAGVGVAVKNAYPRVIGAADALVASNEEDGVAQALEQFLNL